MSNDLLTAHLLDVEGKSAGEIHLPQVFQTSLRLDIIQRAAIAQQSHAFQPQGRNVMAGKRTTAEGFGVGRGISRVPRIGGHGPLSGTAAFAPGTVVVEWRSHRSRQRKPLNESTRKRDGSL